MSRYSRRFVWGVGTTLALAVGFASANVDRATAGTDVGNPAKPPFEALEESTQAILDAIGELDGRIDELETLQLIVIDELGIVLQADLVAHTGKNEFGFCPSGSIGPPGIDVIVRNEGNAPAPETTTLVEASGLTAVELSTPPLAPGEEWPFKVHCAAGSTSCFIDVTVDYDDEVDESDEGNNLETCQEIG